LIPPPADRRLRVTLHAVFFASGVSAIIYQLVWQRVLFGIYGAHIESVTVIVTAFMLGLGAGSLAGGWSADRIARPVAVFAAIEIAIGGFGLVSVSLFRSVGAATAGIEGWVGWLPPLALLLVPTGLMGATLPILVGYATRHSGQVGRSLGGLYAVNTLGSAAGAIAAVLLIVGALGQQGSVTAAAALNLVAAGVVMVAIRREAPAREVVT
jgi:predicted membrane-bound spermidine synthase